ncbi:MAG: YdcF family protein [Paracoccaceae bacterium]|nr:YdcF family protein [Paracoccaceae bacterium]
MRWPKVRRCRLAVIAVLVAGVVSVAAPLLSVLTYADPPLPAGAAAIIVISGPYVPDGPSETRARVTRGVALWRAGAAPQLVLSGNIYGPRGEDIANVMRDQALAAGVPPSAIRLEPRATSTLQNALFTADMLGAAKAAPVIVISNRYHLMRAWASFRWAGFARVTMVAADADVASFSLKNVVLEPLKLPYNLLRAGTASLALAAGATERTVAPFLR